MAQLLNNLFGGSKTTAKATPTGDSDFADFAEAPAPAPPISPIDTTAPALSRGPAATGVPYTKWYNIHERHSLSEFRAEGIILSLLAVVLALHLFGASLNRAKARKWARAHAEPLADQFAVVGFEGVSPVVIERSGDDLIKILADANAARGDAILKEKSLFEFATYATGRQNVAFVDVKLTLAKRFNPIITFAEAVVGFFWDSFAGPEDTCEASLYPFDGKEAQTVPGLLPGAAELKARESKSSAYDGTVWAIVNKERMKQFREERFDLSITLTRDNAKLPAWLTVMTESAEITDVLLTPELIKAAEQAGELLDYLIITDQPIERPKTLDETVPRKRIFLKYRLPSSNDYDSLIPIFSYFLSLPDLLVRQAHFRPNVTRALKEVRDRQINRIRKEAEDEKSEERALEREKAKKSKRDAELAGLDAKQQKKYLEREREKEMRKMTKRSTTRG